MDGGVRVQFAHQYDVGIGHTGDGLLQGEGILPIAAQLVVIEGLQRCRWYGLSGTGCQQQGQGEQRESFHHGSHGKWFGMRRHRG